MKFFRKLFDKQDKNTKEAKGKGDYYYVAEFKDGYALAIRKPEDFHLRDVVIIDENYEKIGNTQYAHTVSLQIDEYKIFKVYSKGSSYVRKMGLLDKNLNVILPLKYDKIHYLAEGKFSAKMHNCTTDIYDMVTGTLVTNIKGEVVSLTKYDGKNYYQFFMKDIGKYGYYDDNFELVIEADYDALYGIDSEGRIPFDKNGKIGVINLKTGKISF